MRQVAVVSGKGGTGKTTLAGAIAYAMPQWVAVDADVDASNLYMLFGPTASERYDYVASKKAVIDYGKCIDCGVCQNVCIFDAVYQRDGKYYIDEFACEGCGYCYYACPVKAISLEPVKSGEYYWADSPRPMAYARLFPGEETSGGLVAEVRRLGLSKAMEQRTSVVIDGAPGVACPAMSSITGTDFVVVVTEPTVSGLHDLERVASLVEHFSIPYGVVINKWDLSPETTERIERWVSERGVELLGKIPFDRHVVEAVRMAQPVLKVFPEAPASKAIKAIIDRLQVILG
jgi:MinD superfamily P-loop ATPase